MNVKPTTLLTGALGVWLLTGTGCMGSMQVNHASAPDLNPQDYQTYAIAPRSVGTEKADPNIQRSIHALMQHRGYENAADTDADLVVTYKVLTEGRSLGPARPAGVARSTLGPVMADDLAINVPPVGQKSRVDKLVVIQLLDRRTLAVVWVGWAQAEVAEDDLVRSASAAARKILSRIPARADG